MLEHLNDSNFDQKISSSKVAMVDIFTSWCGPCRSMSPVVEKIAQEFDGKALIGKLDADESSETAQKFMVRSVPTFLFFKDGQVVDKHIGSISENDMRLKINALL